MASVGDLITRTYTNFRGIDLLNNKNSVDLRRSPDCLNIWKSYGTEQSNVIETRKGFKLLGNFGTEKINGLYIYSSSKAIVHIGTSLKLWTNFPDDPILNTLKSDMVDTKSVMFPYNDKVYILDGLHYLSYDGTNLENVSASAYIPTTTISRKPNGGGETYEDVNLLTGSRKNTFLGDGTSIDYYLDATGINSVTEVKVNGAVTTAYTVNASQGKITFTTAPSSPTLIGQDNVEITFVKNVTGYSDRIEKCTIATIFDNRIFFSGNPEFPNAVFHCSLNNPAYCSDLDYYECGSNDNAIKSLIVGNNLLWVLKKESQNKDTIFYMSPTLDTGYGKIYPTSQGNVSVGCYSEGINYKDSIVFLSRNGLEGITGNISYEQSATHKSSMVDTKMRNMSNYANPNIAEYNGYLLIAIDSNIFLADYRQQFQGTNGNEYEWYLWQLPIVISCLKGYLGELFIGDTEGNIYQMEGTNDNGIAINSYWTTPRDDFGFLNHLKSTNKKGAILKVKNIQNSRIKVAEETNKRPLMKEVMEFSANGFDFNNIDFANFTFSTGESSYVVYKVKEKKIIDISIKVFSDELDKPFGLNSIVLEAYLLSYVKRS